MRIALAMVLLAACGGGTSAPRFPTPVDAEAQVRALEGEWVQAEMNRDPAALQMILDDRFVATFGGAPPMDKATFIAAITQDGPGIKQAISEQRVVIDGDVAVTSGLDTVTDPGKPVPFGMRYTVVYAYRDGHWRPLAQHLALVPPPKPAPDAAGSAAGPDAPAAPAAPANP